MKKIIFAVVLVAGLSACGDQPQALETSTKDSAAYTGTGKAFVNQDWKQGDKASWESQLKARNQYGQNDYTRMN
ncbi:membrane lipoprotein lipid attachment site-containing protein [Rhodoferax sp.]|uniref:membrane lipoprotein lipid attachment site-containing protein n=1 Tax=Rhodoferax sp. TaxID=50421 RepID=UPI0027234D0C|nr:membrane lipoprotein lipid attachment site-containing protein [Rhodoferax sp.]MDO8319927.1 membrane lipoprotein lipid attachment site-containing protein [Rhodoferax sp.]